MKEDLPIGETVKISITSTPSPRVEPILFPTLALSLKAQIEAFLETETEVLRAKQVNGNVNES
jgi:hypothetical protein